MAQTVSFGPKALSDTLLSKLNAPGGANTGISKLGNQLKFKHGLCSVRYQEIEAPSATNLKNNYTVAVGRVASLDSLGVGQMDALPRTIKFSYNSGVAFDIDITVKGMGYDRIDQEQTVSLTIAGSVSDTVETEMPFLGENLEITIAAGGGGLGAGTINIGTGNGVALPIPTSDGFPLVALNLTDYQHFTPGSSRCIIPIYDGVLATDITAAGGGNVLDDVYTFAASGRIVRFYGVVTTNMAGGGAGSETVSLQVGTTPVTGADLVVVEAWTAEGFHAASAITAGGTFVSGDTLDVTVAGGGTALTGGVISLFMEVEFYDPSTGTIAVPSATADKAKPGTYSYTPPAGFEWDGSRSFDILYRPDETYMTVGLESLQHISENWSEYA